MADVSLTDVRKSYAHELAGDPRRDDGDRRRRVHRDRRALGLRQVDAAAHGRRASRRITAGEIAIGGTRRERRRAQGPRHRDGVPELRALPAHDACTRTWPTGCASARMSDGRDRDARAARREDPRAGHVPASASRARSRAASASAWRWAAPSCASRRCSCSTSRCRTSTRSCACRCASRSRSCTARLRTTSLFVTHDQVEAMTLARPHDRDERRRAPSRSARRSRSTTIRRPLFVAGFIGSPAMNFLAGQRAGRRRGRWASGVRVPLPAGAAARSAPQAITVGVRPEHLRGGERRPGVPRSRSTPSRRSAPIRCVHGAFGADTLVARVDGHATPEPGDGARLRRHAGQDSTSSTRPRASGCAHDGRMRGASRS